MTLSRQHALALFQAGVAAADPYAAVERHIGKVARPALIIAVGKAAIRMAEAALHAFGGVPCIVVTNYENAKDLAGATVMAAGHPVPDENGARAGAAVTQAIRGADGPILALISGGGSALLPAPVAGVSLAEKAAVNEALLGAGLDIVEMNLVRQQLSQLKGGGFLRLAAPHAVTALILSDVIGDDLSAIASGPTAAPLGTAEEARLILEKASIWNGLPDSVKVHLKAGRKAVAVTDGTNILVGSNSQSVAAMAAVDGAHVIETSIVGDVEAAAKAICDACAPGVTVWGGETTVMLKGTGRGGRNQELALRVAVEARKRGWTDWICLQGGSDGRDGPTDAAGGLADAGTLMRIAQAGGDIEALLANNDSYGALDLAGDLLITDATGTNVADLGIMIRGA